MASFKNREELLDLLLDKTERVIEDFSKEVTWGESFTVKQLYKLQDLCEEIRNYRSMNPKKICSDKEKDFKENYNSYIEQ